MIQEVPSNLSFSAELEHEHFVDVTKNMFKHSNIFMQFIDLPIWNLNLYNVEEI